MTGGFASSSRSAAETRDAARGGGFASPSSATRAEDALLEAKKNEAPSRGAFLSWCLSWCSGSSEPNVSARPRQQRDRCAAAAPAESPMMSSQPQLCSFHICTSSPGERDCRNVSGSATRGWYGATAGVAASAFSPRVFEPPECLREDERALFFPSSAAAETASATLSSASAAAASPPAARAKSPPTNAVASGRFS